MDGFKAYMRHPWLSAPLATPLITPPPFSPPFQSAASFTGPSSHLTAGSGFHVSVTSFGDQTDRARMYDN